MQSVFFQKKNTFFQLCPQCIFSLKEKDENEVEVVGDELDVLRY